MVSSVSSLLNSILASNFSEVGDKPPASPFSVLPSQARTVVATVKSEDATLNQKRQEEQKQQTLLTQQQADSRQRSLKDIARPQVSLLPSDELDLFAQTVQADTEAADAITEPFTIIQSSFVSDETNRSRRQALSQNDRDSLSQILQQRAQASVATLYARNNNVVYNVETLFSEAA